MKKHKHEHRSHYAKRHHRKKISIGGVSFVVILVVGVGAFLWSYVTSEQYDIDMMRRSLVQVDISSIANTDYHLDTTRPEPSARTFPRYPGMVSGGIVSGVLQYEIPYHYTKQTGRWSVFTTCNNDAVSTVLPLESLPSRSLYLLVDGCNFHSTEQDIFATLKVTYKDGSWEKKDIRYHYDAWDFISNVRGNPINPEKVAWDGGEGQKLVTIQLDLNPEKVPVSLTIEQKHTPDKGGFILFAVTQLKDY